jgi:arylsulfatase A-like enzyme
MFYYHGMRLFGARKGDYKLYYYANNPMGYPEELEQLESVQLYNLQHDPSERFDLADEHQDIIEEIETLVEAHKDTVTPVESELDKVIGQ